MKKKWTFADTLIVLLVAVAGVGVVKVFGTDKAKGDDKVIEAVVLLAKEDAEVAGAISEGDEITISLTEKDTGVLKSVRTEEAREMVYNSIDGKYVTELVEGKVDIYAVIELNTAENDCAFTAGSTVIKVGEKLPFRSKGYALEGFVIEIND